ncbi:MAG: putative cadmium-transporting ATPase [Chloroflexi bacterium ADurb.Bin180]|nr:MAG: putative cadmium-transporting ATPase [Chloroflexi bacterium ADurb.Bin180]
MTQHITLPIKGLDCADCARALEGGVAQLEGVVHPVLNFASSSLAVEYDPARVSLGSVMKRIKELGYDVAGETLTFQLEGLDCADCAAKLQQAAANVPGVLSAQVNFVTAEMHLLVLPRQAVEQAVFGLASEMGYRVRTAAETDRLTRDEPRSNWRIWLYERRRTVLTVLSGSFLVLALVAGRLDWNPILVSGLFALAMLCGGVYIARSGWAALRTTHTLDMNMLMTIAAIGAAAIGEWAEGASAMFLFSLGNTLEAMTMDRARSAIRRLIALSPREATRVHGDHADRVPVEQLAVGDLIEVKPGERVAMDGAIEQGRSSVDQSPVTGESVPVDVQPGSPVYAGSINGQGALLVRVTRLASDNTLSRIVQMVQEAQGRRAPAQRFVDTFARYYTPAVIALAAGVAVLPPLISGAPFLTWLYRALVLLVISCPCALVISTPVAIVSAISSAARKGVLVKGGMYLESIAKVRAVAFDKTGTLTEGRPAVVDIVPLGSVPSLPGLAQEPTNPADRVLTVAAAIDVHSQHPVARAIQAEARTRGLALPQTSEYQQLVGFGGQARFDGSIYYIGNHALFTDRVPHAEEVCGLVEKLEAEGKTVVLVGSPDGVLGVISVADRVRPSSPAVLKELKHLGVSHTVLLTGDNQRTAQAIGRAVGVDEIRAGLMPQDKVEAVEQVLKDYGSTVMVGDGVNDAPAMARASVGVAMGAAGTDAALETADIVLMSDDLTRVPYVMRLGRSTIRHIQQNIALSLLIKGVFLALALMGRATLWMAVFADMGTSLIVTLNGMRLLRAK